MKAFPTYFQPPQACANWGGKESLSLQSGKEEASE